MGQNVILLDHQQSLTLALLYKWSTEGRFSRETFKALTEAEVRGNS